MTPPSQTDPRPEIQCFVPAYDEEALIVPTVTALAATLAGLTPRYEVVVVDDASTDATVERVRALNDPRVRVVTNATGPSFRENLGRAMAAGRADVLAFIDADLSPDPAGLAAVIRAVREGADVAVGNRYAPGSVTVRTPARWLASRLYNGAMRLALGSPFVDHQCGLKAFRRQALHALLAVMHAEPHPGRSWFWDVELLVRATWAGYRVVEVPIRWTYRKGGHFMAARQVRMLPSVMALWRERPR